MVVVKTKVLPSEAREGLGLFADQTIAVGTLVWKATVVECLWFLNDPRSQKLYERWGYYNKNLSMYILPKDDGRYIKSAFDRLDKNLNMDSDGHLYCCSIIRKGDELLSLFPEFMTTIDINKLEKFDKKEKEDMQEVRTSSIHF